MTKRQQGEWLAGMSFRDIVFTWLIVFGFYSLADWNRQHPGDSRWLHPDLSEQIGAEYDTIAIAIRQGRGFSDPFREPSGPTAWMPPILVYFTAGLYWITNDQRDKVVETIVVINWLVVLFASFMVTATAKRLNRPWTGYLILTVALAADFFELFQRTHDTWLILLMLSLMWVGIQWLPDPQQVRWPTAVAWGLFGGICALCGPVAGFTWAVLTTLFWFPWRRSEEPVDQEAVTRLRARGFCRSILVNSKALFIAATVSMLTVSPWMIRNRLVMGTWIPVKSNAMYEVWQSQVLDDEGVLDSSSAFQHPWGSRSAQRVRYLELGELAFIKEKGDVAKASIRENPQELAKRIINRGIAACVYYQPLVADDERMIGRMRFIRTYFPLPFISLLVIFAFRSCRYSVPLRATIVLYITYLMPYILISYYDRYAAPAFLFKAILILYAIDTLANRFISEADSAQNKDSVECQDKNFSTEAGT